MLTPSDLAVFALGAGILLAYLGLAGRILPGVGGAVIATIALARLTQPSALARVHPWTFAALFPALLVGLWLTRIAAQARANKRR